MSAIPSMPVFSCFGCKKTDKHKFSQNHALMANNGNALHPGTVLESKSHSYRIDRTLGQGTFGITYLAYTQVTVGGVLGEVESEIPVAVKEFFMNGFYGREGSTVTHGSKDGVSGYYWRKFTSEARNLSRMRHKGIVKVIETFDANDTSYYAMEYCGGGSLDSLIMEHGSLPEDVALNYFTRIADALAFMHDNKMLHLDLKPGNIMLRSSGEPVLIDFGLSKQYNKDGEPESSTSIGNGTPGYAPVEQANYKEGNGFPVTMDIYALGATLYKMLTGERPPAAAELLETFPEDELRAHHVSEGIIACIRRAMQPVASRRYRSVREFASAVQIGTAENSEQTDIIATPLTHRHVYPTPKQQKAYKPWKPAMPHLPSIKPIFEKAGSSRQRMSSSTVSLLRQLTSPQWKKRFSIFALVAGSVLFAIFASLLIDSAIARKPIATALHLKGNSYWEAGDSAKAITCYKVAAAIGDSYSPFELACAYNNGKFVEKNENEAYNWLIKAAENGDYEIQYIIAHKYYGNQNYTEAIKWFDKVKDSPILGIKEEALNYIGACYENKKEYATAIKYYQESAEGGSYPYANFNLGRCYEEGLGVKQDIDKAKSYYQSARDDIYGLANEAYERLKTGKTTTESYPAVEKPDFNLSMTTKILRFTQ